MTEEEFVQAYEDGEWEKLEKFYFTSEDLLTEALNTGNLPKELEKRIQIFLKKE